MKILVVSQYYFPEQFQINEIVPELVRRGHKVTVLCGTPNYPLGKTFPGYGSREERAAREAEYLKENGVEVIHCAQTPRKRGPLFRILNYFSFAFNATRMVRTLPGDFDAVFCYQLSPVLMLMPAAAYAGMHKVPLMAYVLDIWPESAKSYLPPLLFKLVSRLSARLYRKCDRLLVTSQSFTAYLSEVNGVDRGRTAYLPQHADASMLPMDLTRETDGVRHFLFAGNLGKAQRLDVILDAVRIIGKRKDYMVHFVGDGSMREKLQKKAAQMGIESNLSFDGPRSRSEMPEVYRKSDCLLLTLKGDNAVGNTMPGKLQTYMTTGKPVLGAINGDASGVIGLSGCGKCVSAGDAAGLSALMMEFIVNPESFSGCGERGRRYFSENFTLGVYMDALERELKNLTTA